MTFRPFPHTSLIPSVDDGYSLGSPSNRWKDGYFANNSLHISSTSAETGTARNWSFGISPDGHLSIGEGGNEHLSVNTSGGLGVTSGYYDIPEQTAPATPGSGVVRLYAKTDGYIYAKNDAGSESNLSSSALGGGGITWTEVTGINQQAVSNAGYITNNSDGYQVTITLPATPSIGDIIRVSGTVRSGWKIAQNTGQEIINNIINPHASWTQRDSSREWVYAASSSDGVKLIATVNPGYIYTSTDSGISWTQRSTSSERYGIASSADGTKLVAGTYSSYIYTSTDSGVNWTQQTGSGSRQWYGIASSADGTKLVAGTYSSYIYTSTDSGVNWTQRDSTRSWRRMASSADGTKLVAMVNSGYIYTSTDSGVNWTERTAAGSRAWSGIASSADGTKLVAMVNSGYIYTSTDSGVNWTERTAAGSRAWFGIASSADGYNLAAVAQGPGYIYTSTDSGVNWTERTAAGSRSWADIAASSDGAKLVATVTGGYIYTAGWTKTTYGTAGYTTSRFNLNSIDIQYIGSGTFKTIGSLSDGLVLY